MENRKYKKIKNKNVCLIHSNIYIINYIHASFFEVSFPGMFVECKREMILTFMF